METPTKAVTTEVAKQEINIALTKQSLLIQNIQTEADNLIVNEDHLQEIADFIRKTRSADKVIDEKHEQGKRPHLEAGRNWDAAKNDLKGMIADIRKKIEVKYTALCKDIERRKQEELQKEARKKAIIANIENTVIDFSGKVASCTTSKELQAIESVINLEKSTSRKIKYEEFHQQAIDKYNEVLMPIIKNQKAKIKEYEELERKMDEAAKASNVEEMDTLQDKKELVQEQISQNKINVQQQALNQTSAPSFEPATVVYPTVKPRRTTWEWEVKDINKTVKKMPEWTTVNVDANKVEDYLITKKKEGIPEDVKEFEFAGIRFFEKKIY